MSALHEFVVFLPTDASRGRVIVDGVELRGVTAVEIRGRVGGTTEVVVHLHPALVTVRGETERLRLAADCFEHVTSGEPSCSPS